MALKTLFLVKERRDVFRSKAMRTCIIILLSAAALSTQLLEKPKERSVSYKTSFVAFPADCNANPPMVFGGKLLSEMDRCAAITARRFLYESKIKDAVTVLINNVKFHAPAQVKDLIIVSATVREVGEKSITIWVRVEKETEDELTLLVDGEFVFVAYDIKTKKSVPHGLKLK